MSNVIDTNVYGHNSKFKKILQPLVNCEDRIVEQLFTTYLNNDQIVQPQSGQCGVSNIQ